jgi:hypothetical protein
MTVYKAMTVYEAMQTMTLDQLRWFIYYHHKDFGAGYKKILAFLESEYEPEKENPTRPAEKG